MLISHHAYNYYLNFILKFCCFFSGSWILRYIDGCQRIKFYIG